MQVETAPDITVVGSKDHFADGLVYSSTKITILSYLNQIMIDLWKFTDLILCNWNTLYSTLLGQ